MYYASVPNKKLIDDSHAEIINALYRFNRDYKNYNKKLYMDMTKIVVITPGAKESQDKFADELNRRNLAFDETYLCTSPIAKMVVEGMRSKIKSNFRTFSDTRLAWASLIA